MQFVPYGRQSIDETDLKAVKEVLFSDYLTCGPAIPKFEEAFSKFTGSKHAIAVSSATSALHLSVKALKKNNKKVLSTPLTFAATTNSILYNQLEVEFIDIDQKTFLMDLDLLEERLII